MKNKLLPKLALLTATLIWGSSFIIVKSTTDAIPPNFLIAIRFLVAAVLLALVFIKRIIKINKSDLIVSVPIGFCLFFAYSVQTLGITQTTPGKNAFLTAVYCVLVPFIAWFFKAKRPDVFNIVAAFVCIAGIFLVAVKGDFSIGAGDAFTLLGGVFYAIHIVLVSKLAKDRDPFVITVLQFAVAAVFSWATAFAFETMPNFAALDITVWLSVLYLIVACTMIGLLLQNIGQKYTDPSSAALILSLEAVFGVLFSVIMGQEEMSLRLIIGFALIFVSVIISESKLSFVAKYFRKSS